METGERTHRLTELVHRHYANLYRYAYRLSNSESDAEDLVQQAFLTAQAKLEQLRDAESAEAWLFRIVRNDFLKRLRRNKLLSVCSLDRVEEPAESSDAEPVVDSDRLQQILGEMPEQYRAPVILYYFEQFTYKEMADRLEVPIGTIMSRLARGRAYLRRRLMAELEVASEVPAIPQR